MYNLVSFSIFFNQVTLKFLLHPSNLPIKLFQVSRIYFQKFGELWNFFYRFNKIRLDFVANPRNYLHLQAVFWGLIRECVGGEVRAFHKDSLTYKYNALIVSNLVWLWGEFWWKLTRFFVIIICWKLSVSYDGFIWRDTFQRQGLSVCWSFQELVVRQVYLWKDGITYKENFMVKHARLTTVGFHCCFITMLYMFYVIKIVTSW